MLIALVPATFYDLPCVRLVLLDSGVCQESHVIVYIEVEQGA